MSKPELKPGQTVTVTLEGTVRRWSEGLAVVMSDVNGEELYLADPHRWATTVVVSSEPEPKFREGQVIEAVFPGGSIIRGTLAHYYRGTYGGIGLGISEVGWGLDTLLADAESVAIVEDAPEPEPEKVDVSPARATEVPLETQWFYEALARAYR